MNPKEKLDFLIKQIEGIQSQMDSLNNLSLQQPNQKDYSAVPITTPSQPVDSTMDSSRRLSIDSYNVDEFDTALETEVAQTQKTQQQPPIPKPRGNYVNIPKTLNISKMKHNEFQNHIRDLVKLHIDINKEYKMQSPKTIELIVSKFKKRNPDFPNTINDWPIRMMIKRVINNIRDYRRKGKEEHENKKSNKVPKRSKNKESGSNSDPDQDNDTDELSNDKNKEGNSEEDFFDKMIRFAENSRAKQSQKFVELVKEIRTRQIIDESDDIANKSDDREENANEVETEQKEKVPPVTRAKRKQMENEVINSKKNKVPKQNRQPNKKNRNL